MLLRQRQFGNAIAVGDLWETVFVGEQQVAEFFLQGDSSFGSRAIGLGYNSALDARDLAFSNTSAEGQQLASIVRYLPAARALEATMTVPEPALLPMSLAAVCGLAWRRLQVSRR